MKYGITKQSHCYVKRCDYVLVFRPGHLARTIREWLFEIPPDAVFETEIKGDPGVVQLKFRGEQPEMPNQDLQQQLNDLRNTCRGVVEGVIPIAELEDLVNKPAMTKMALDAARYMHEHTRPL